MEKNKKTNKANSIFIDDEDDLFMCSVNTLIALVIIPIICFFVVKGVWLILYIIDHFDLLTLTSNLSKTLSDISMFFISGALMNAIIALIGIMYPLFITNK